MDEPPIPAPEARLLGAYWLDSPVLEHRACSCNPAAAREAEPAPGRRPPKRKVRVTVIVVAVLLVGAGLAMSWSP